MTCSRHGHILIHAQKEGLISLTEEERETYRVALRCDTCLALVSDGTHDRWTGEEHASRVLDALEAKRKSREAYPTGHLEVRWDAKWSKYIEAFFQAKMDIILDPSRGPYQSTLRSVCCSYWQPLRLSELALPWTDA